MITRVCVKLRPPCGMSCSALAVSCCALDLSTPFVARQWDRPTRSGGAQETVTHTRLVRGQAGCTSGLQAVSRLGLCKTTAPACDTCLCCRNVSRVCPPSTLRVHHARCLVHDGGSTKRWNVNVNSDCRRREPPNKDRHRALLTGPRPGAGAAAARHGRRRRRSAAANPGPGPAKRR